VTSKIETADSGCRTAPGGGGVLLIEAAEGISSPGGKQDLNCKSQQCQVASRTARSINQTLTLAETARPGFVPGEQFVDRTTGIAGW